jgi:DNA polymerase-3 subunit delta'
VNSFVNGKVIYPWQSAAWERLASLRETGRLPHALLLTGSKGGGMDLFAQVFAAALLCEKPSGFACGTCKTCHLVEAHSHPDFRILAPEEDSKQIKVDQVREVVDFVGMTSQMGGRKVVLVDGPERMNQSASNALLKSLEEPSRDTVLLLVTDAPHRLLPTIRSRCQSVELPLPSPVEAERWLCTFVPDGELRQKLLLLADNNPLLAMEYQNRGVSLLLDKLLASLQDFQRGVGSAVRAAEGAKNLDMALWLTLNQKIVHELVCHALKTPPRGTLGLGSLLQVSERKGFVQNAYRLLDEVQQAVRDIQSTSNPDLAMLMESLLIRWQALLRS